jgi:RNA polymerase sigma-70 factor (ECF subfamily)
MVNRKTLQMGVSIRTASPPAAAGECAALPDPGDLMAVVGHYQGRLLRYVGRMLGSIDHEAEDIVQEAFVRLHRQVSRQGPHSVKHLTTWLFRTAHNLTLDSIRRQSRRKRATEAISDAAQTAEERAADEMDALSEVLRREARDAALRELAKLDDEQRQVVLLRIIQGMSLREVAEVAGISISLVNYRLNQGLAELARRLRKASVL